MALPVNLSQRERDKFVEDIAGKVAVRGYDDAVFKQLQVINSLTPSAYDSITTSFPNSSTEVYVFKSGGVGGTTVSTITVIYTDSTKENLSSVVRT